MSNDFRIKSNIKKNLFFVRKIALEIKKTKDMSNYFIQRSSSRAYRPSSFTAHSYKTRSAMTKIYYFMDYLPIRFNSTDEQIEDREDIFRFKDGYRVNRIYKGFADGITRLADADTVVCFVPASTAAKTKRRYEKVAKYLQGQTGIECSCTAIQKPIDGESGHVAGKTSNPAAEFTFDPNVFFGKKVILVDDVVTRGTTLESTARQLKRYGAKEVIGLVAGRTINPYRPWRDDSRNLERL